MTTGRWDESRWDRDHWGEVLPPPPPPPPPDAHFQDTGIRMFIEMGTSTVVVQDIGFGPLPSKIFPRRNFRAVMNDYRIRMGVPANPPVLDIAIPIIVDAAHEEIPIPDEGRALPHDIDTNATLRWIAEEVAIVIQPDGAIMWWTDTTGVATWVSHEAYQPVLDSDYSYVLPGVGSDPRELVMRQALVFDPSAANHMSTVLSTLPSTPAGSEWLIVAWMHPLAVGALYGSILDNGEEITDYHDMPYPLDEPVIGKRAHITQYPGALGLGQGSVDYPTLAYTPTANGRPILIHARFGADPLLQLWAAGNTHLRRQGAHTDFGALATNFVLGRVNGLLSEQTNAAMHIFEVNYYDHPMGDGFDDIVDDLRWCYGVSQ